MSRCQTPRMRRAEGGYRKAARSAAERRRAPEYLGPPISTIREWRLSLPVPTGIRIGRQLKYAVYPWGWGRSLEWATSCPPPRHNFETIPRIRSESPAFDVNHPEVAVTELEENVGLTAGGPTDAPSMEGREEHLRERMETDEPD